MHVPFTSEEIGYGVGLPALIGLALLWNLRWMLLGSMGRRYACPIAFSAATVAGYWFLKLGPVQPETHWQWLPHLLLIAAVIGMVSASEDLNNFDRFLLFAIATGAAGFQLVPTWEDLTPPRQQYLLGLTILVVVLSLSYQRLIQNMEGALFPAVLTMTCLTASILLMHSGSLLFCQIGLSATGATFGMTVAAKIDKKSRSLDGLAFPFVFFLCNALMIGHTNSFSSIPNYVYAIIPFAPLGLLIASKSPSANAKGKKAIAIQFIIPLVVCVAALAIAFWFEPLSGEEAY